MMGLPAGWVTDVPLEDGQLDLFAGILDPLRRAAVRRTEQLRILGNGVVPQQAAAAVRALLTYAPPYLAECAA
jgi:hypothetical protein